MLKYPDEMQILIRVIWFNKAILSTDSYDIDIEVIQLIRLLWLCRLYTHSVGSRIFHSLPSASPCSIVNETLIKCKNQILAIVIEHVESLDSLSGHRGCKCSIGVFRVQIRNMD